MMYFKWILLISFLVIASGCEKNEAQVKSDGSTGNKGLVVGAGDPASLAVFYEEFAGNLKSLVDGNNKTNETNGTADLVISNYYFLHILEKGKGLSMEDIKSGVSTDHSISSSCSITEDRIKQQILSSFIDPHGIRVVDYSGESDTSHLLNPESAVIYAHWEHDGQGNLTVSIYSAQVTDLANDTHIDLLNLEHTNTLVAFGVDRETTCFGKVVREGESGASGGAFDDELSTWIDQLKALDQAAYGIDYLTTRRETSRLSGWQSFNNVIFIQKLNEQGGSCSVLETDISRTIIESIDEKLEFTKVNNKIGRSNINFDAVNIVTSWNYVGGQLEIILDVFEINSDYVTSNLLARKYITVDPSELGISIDDQAECLNHETIIAVNSCNWIDGVAPKYDNGQGCVKDIKCTPLSQNGLLSEITFPGAKCEMASPGLTCEYSSELIYDCARLYFSNAEEPAIIK